MIYSIINFSIKNKLVIILASITLILGGIYSITQLPIGAVPDITNNQVQVITTSRNLSTQDIEQFITYPIELEMANLPGVKEIRSISKFGLSVITIVFDDDMGNYLPRQLIAEKIKSAQEKIPEGFGTPEMGPISTGLGEIYQYILDTKPGYDSAYSAMDLRTIQDWVVKRQLSGIRGVVEINTWGGYLKQYEVTINPSRLRALKLTINDIFSALQNNNDITGGGYIEKTSESYFVRGEGMVKSLDDIQKIVVKNIDGIPILIGDVGTVHFGYATRFGAITGNGKGEKVLGQIMMLKDANSAQVIEEVKERVAEVQKILPEGVFINPFLERTELIEKTTFTITENLVLGALIVIFVLVLLLGNLRSGLIVASVIPLSLLFAIILMNIFEVSANLMSLGAIDFGIIIDGAVIIVEYVVHQFQDKKSILTNLSKTDLQKEKDKLTAESSGKMMRSAIFGQIIILIVFIPILSLTDIEGKMFKPMALSFSFALIGAMILCLTYVPVMSALFLKPPANDRKNLSDKLMEKLDQIYLPSLKLALMNKKIVLIGAIVMLIFASFIFFRMGGEFIPTLDEGDYVVQPILRPGTSLSENIRITTQIENILLSKFPEVDQVVSRIGAAEVPTDPMSMEMSDIIIKLKDKNQWTSARSKEELADKMKKELSVLPGIEYEFTQPIEMRFNELVTGVRADVAIKIYGEDLQELYDQAVKIKNSISHVQGASDISVEQIVGLPQMAVEYKREKIAQYGLNIKELNALVNMAFAGVASGSVFEGEKRFDLVVRLDENNRQNIDDIRSLYVSLPNGEQVPLEEIADIIYKTGPAQISRDDTRRRIVIGINVRNRDIESIVNEIQGIIDEKINLPKGYYITYGGQFENLQKAKNRLSVAVPVALLLIFVLLHFTFSSFKQALMVYTAIPLAAIGGVLLLWMRGLPFSISAGVGFIALFGIAVLNGIVMVSFFNELKKGGVKDVYVRVISGARQRLRPVLLTASAAALGFFPMAFSTSAGAEVQRPLATVVIGGLFSATLLTLFVLPVVYTIFSNKKNRHFPKKLFLLLIIPAISLTEGSAYAQVNETLSLEEAINIALQNNARLKASSLQIKQSRINQKSSFDPGKTMFFYGTEENKAEIPNVGIYSFGIQQNIEFPTTYSAQSKINKQVTDLSSLNYDLSQKILIKNVSQSYYKLNFFYQKFKLIQHLDSLYEKFNQAANTRYNVGETGYQEKLTAQAKSFELKISLKQVAADIAQNRQILQSYLQVNEPVEIKADSLPMYEYNPPPADTHTQLDAMHQITNIAHLQYILEKNKLLPGFQFQYFLQKVNQTSGFYGYQLGLTVPLWFLPQQTRIQTAKIQEDISKYNQANYAAEFNARREALEEKLAQLAPVIEDYQNEGLQMITSLLHVAERTYLEGESGYIAYVQNLEQALQMQLSFFENLDQYNQAAIELHFIQ